MTVERQGDVYERLYQIVADNMAKSGETIRIDKEAFLSTVGSPIREKDLLAIVGLRRMSFLQAAYILFLHRFPDDPSIMRWEAMTERSDEEVRRALTEQLRQSEEFRKTGFSIRNNIYTNNTPRSVESGGSAVFHKLRTMWMKIPEWIKKGVRRILGVAG